MNQSNFLSASLMAFFIAGAAVAQPSLNMPLPAPSSAQPTRQDLPGPVATPVAKGPAGGVDKVLERISRNMEPASDLIDSQSEAAINRDLNLSRSTGQMLRPVGYMQIQGERSIFASEDGIRVLKLKEKSRFGVMKIAHISEDGVEYKVSGKTMYAPLAYMAAEGPKAVPVVNIPLAQAPGVLPAPIR